MKVKLLVLIFSLTVGFVASAAEQILSADETRLVQYINKNKNAQLNFLAKLVNINSGTENSRGVTKIADLVKTELEHLGFHTQWISLPAEMKHAGTLVATHSGSGKKLLMIGHLDTVFPPSSPFQSFKLSADHRVASGPGVIDDKGGVVTILYALKALKQTGILNQSNISIVLTGDEEHSAKPIRISRKALKEAAKGCDVALGFEFSLAGNQLVTSRRGIAAWTLTSSGKSGHSSTIFSADSGFGAIYETARILNDFRTTLENYPEVTLNPGIILGGQDINLDKTKGFGSSSGQKNIVASKTYVQGDLRFSTSEQLQVVEKRMEELTHASLPLTSSQLVFTTIMPGMPDRPANRSLLAEFSDISLALGGGSIEAVPAAERGGADIAFVAQQVPAAIDGLGPWGKGAHSNHELLDIDSLAEATKRAAIYISRQAKSASK